ncbi:FtsX-like permease family protein [Gorillibacterium massiliense]|uniref:ABC transporter permease n=1 Tax=Gorillibacterium massiliense TaxID=1280390 RepID=UPI0004BB5622|nr:ABC transporter permease [Gorillibacterium massiliense]
MALFLMLIRKMAQNKWLAGSLFFGMLMTVALVSTMPIYTEGVLSRMLVKDLEKLQTDRGIRPGIHYSLVNYMQSTNDSRKKAMYDLDRFMEREHKDFGLPVIEYVTDRRTQSARLVPEQFDPKKADYPYTALRSYSGIYDHIKLTDGRLPSDKPVDGVYEALVTDQTLRKYKMVLGNVFYLKDKRITETIKVKPVGVFEKKTDNDPYFYNAPLSDFANFLVVDENLFQTEILDKNKVDLQGSSWYTVLDYSKIELNNVHQFLAADKLVRKTVNSKVSSIYASYDMPALDTISRYFDREKQLRKLMWALNVPVLIMLGFYMFMVSNLIVERQKNEIAVLRSRGASRWQVITSFAGEGLILGGAALALGPPLGLFLTDMLGASSGFLVFVQRAKLPLHLTGKAYLYGAVAAAVAFVMTMIPVLLATRVSIVGRKQEMARSSKRPLWHKAFLDVLALGVSIYGLITFRSRLKDMKNLALGVDDLKLDPLQFIVPALFILGAGLFLLRLYPYVLRFIYWLGRRWWSPAAYSTLIQVGRSSSQYQFLMIFMVLTIAVGVFSAGAARTINSNIEERIRYGNGADIVIQPVWVNDAPTPTGPGAPSAASQPSSSLSKPLHYLEPAFYPYTKLPGVEQAAKVFIKREATFTANQKNGSASLVGIDTDDFGRTSWFPDGLLAHPFNEYLNVLASDSRGVLVSKTLADQMKVKVGDSIYVGWEGVNEQPFIVFGIIDYFPTFNPNPRGVTAGTTISAPMLIVGHLSRIQFQLGLEPYQVWLKLKPGASIAALYDGIEKSAVNINGVVNTRDSLVNAKNDPFLLAVNGILTLGFLLSMTVTFTGFLLYWILSLRGRTLQNGILRAIGLSLRQLISMLALEQLLTSGVAIGIGVVVGNVTGRLYVPNFQMAFNPGSLVPPFRVIFASVDFVRLYTVVGVMLAVGLIIIGYMLSRLKIHQALKLGED